MIFVWFYFYLLYYQYTRREVMGTFTISVCMAHLHAPCHV